MEAAVKCDLARGREGEGESLPLIHLFLRPGKFSAFLFEDDRMRNGILVDEFDPRSRFHADGVRLKGEALYDDPRNAAFVLRKRMRAWSDSRQTRKRGCRRDAVPDRR